MNTTEPSAALYAREQARIRDLLDRLRAAIDAHAQRQHRAAPDDLGPAGDLARAAADLQMALSQLAP